MFFSIIIHLLLTNTAEKKLFYDINVGHNRFFRQAYDRLNLGQCSKAYRGIICQGLYTVCTPDAIYR